MTLGALSRATPALALLCLTGCTLDLDALTAGTVGAGGSGGSASSSTASTGGGGMGGNGGMGGGGMGGDAGAGNMPSEALRVQYSVAMNYLPNDNTLKPQIKIINQSATDIPLDEVTVRYWYTNETITQEQFNCDFSNPNVCAGQVSGVFSVWDPPHKKANRYIELSFRNSMVTLTASGGSFEIHARVQATAAGNYDETNDYSYDATPPMAFEDSTVITAYVMGELAWGFEPQ